MHILSWNVAGWSTTCEKIKRRHSSIANWLNLLKVDVLCIQEVKLDKSYIAEKAREIGAILDDYDTFWSYPKGEKGKAQQKRGLNGVATFAKKGLITKANSNVFGDPEFDNEGRCIMTDHGSFVIFNVYVPFSGENHIRLPYKIRFLNALQSVMRSQRDLGKMVVLLGDLNIAPRSIDICRDFRKLEIPRLLRASFQDDQINVGDESITLSTTPSFESMCTAASDFSNSSSIKVSHSEAIRQLSATINYIRLVW